MGAELLGAVAGSILGVDLDEGAIDHAKVTHASANIRFCRVAAEEFIYPSPADMTVIIEALEHFENPEEILRNVRENTLYRIFISVPLGKTTDKNPFHKTDFVNPDKLGLMMQDEEWYLIHNAFQKMYPGEHLMMVWERRMERKSDVANSS